MSRYLITYLGGNQPSTPEEGKHHFAKYKEWLSSIGDAVVSLQHANFLINTNKASAKEIEDLLVTFLKNAKPGILKNNRVLEDEIRKVVRKHCIRKYKKYPMIVPTLFVM